MFWIAVPVFFVLVVLLNSFEIVARGGIIISHWEAGIGRMGLLTESSDFGWGWRIYRISNTTFICSS